MKYESTTAISIDDFIDTCHNEVYVPVTDDQIRHVASTLSEVEFRRVVVNSEDLLRSRAYSAWDTNSEQTQWIESDAPKDMPRHSLSFSDLLNNAEMLKQKLAHLEVERRDRPKRPTPHAMTLHCSSCESRWFLDGNCGFTRLCASGDHGPITLTEMSSGDWQGMHRVCCCK